MTYSKFSKFTILIVSMSIVNFKPNFVNLTADFFDTACAKELFRL